MLEEFVGASGSRNRTASGWSHGQHLMQASSDIFLGWQSVDGVDGVRRDFYVRQLRDWKGSADVETMTPATMTTSTRGCAAGRWPAPTPDPATASRSPRYLGSGDVFDQAIAEFSEAYADQNERDYALLVQAESDGRIDVRRGL